MSDYLPVPLSRRGGLDHDSAAARLLRAFLNGRKAETITAYRQDLEDFQAFIQAPTLEQAARSRASGQHDQPQADGSPQLGQVGQDLGRGFLDD
jgi:hypothetical protein